MGFVAWGFSWNSGSSSCLWYPYLGRNPFCLQTTQTVDSGGRSYCAFYSINIHLFQALSLDNYMIPMVKPMVPPASRQLANIEGWWNTFTMPWLVLGITTLMRVSWWCLNDVPTLTNTKIAAVDGLFTALVKQDGTCLNGASAALCLMRRQTIDTFRWATGLPSYNVPLPDTPPSFRSWGSWVRAVCTSTFLR